MNAFATQREGAAETALILGATRDQAGRSLGPAEAAAAIERVIRAEGAVRDGLTRPGSSKALCTRCFDCVGSIHVPTLWIGIRPRKR